jgi:DNA-binding MarR family transcriptional regulator
MTDEYVVLLEKLTALRKLRMKILNEINAGLKDINSRDFVVLHRICKENGEPTMSDLSESTGLSNALITSAVDNLERNGFVHRERGTDRRSYSVKLTERGADKCHEMEAAKKRMIDTFFKNMSKEDLKELQDVLKRLSDLIEKYS